jgi:hypothetical protein
MEATPVFLVFGTRDIWGGSKCIEAFCYCKWYEQSQKKSTKKDDRVTNPSVVRIRLRSFFWQFQAGQ